MTFTLKPTTAARAATDQVEVDRSDIYPDTLLLTVSEFYGGERHEASAYLTAPEADALIAGIDAALDREPVPLRDELLAFTSWLDKVSGLAPMDSTVDAYLATLDGAPAEPEGVPGPELTPVAAASLVVGEKYRVLPGFRSGSRHYTPEALSEGAVVVFEYEDDTTPDRDGDVFVVSVDRAKCAHVLPEYLAPITSEETP